MRVLAISIIVLLLVGNVNAASPTLSNSGGRDISIITLYRTIITMATGLARSSMRM
jgi:hypothetical protein